MEKHSNKMLGNFELQSASRQTLTMEARSHVEVLIIKTAVMRKILSNYPHLRELYKETVQVNRDFVMSLSQKESIKDEEAGSQTSSQSSIRSSRSSIVSAVAGIGSRVYSANNKYIKLWEVYILMCGSFMSYFLILYQASLQEHSIVLWVLQYVVDLTYIIKIFLKFHVAFEDEFGDVIVDLKRIALMYLKDPFGLYLDILTTIPFEVLAFAVGEFRSSDFLRACSLLHMNRLPRISYLKLQDLSPVLLKKVWKYLLSLWDHKRGTQVPSILSEAPGYLLEAIKTSLYGHLIYTNYVFCRGQTDFLRQIVVHLKEYNFFPGNYITFQGEINDSMYFVYSGEVEVLSEGEDLYCSTREDVLKAGDVFGMMQGLYPLRLHKYSYRALTITLVLILQRRDWEYLLRFFPESSQDIYERATSLQFTF